MKFKGARSSKVDAGHGEIEGGGVDQIRGHAQAGEFIRKQGSGLGGVIAGADAANKDGDFDVLGRRLHIQLDERQW